MTRGEKIKSARKELGRGWTQEALAKEMRRLGVKKTWSWIAGIENNRFKPHFDDLKILASVLKKPLEYFHDDASKSKEEMIHEMHREREPVTVADLEATEMNIISTLEKYVSQLREFAFKFTEDEAARWKRACDAEAADPDKRARLLLLGWVEDVEKKHGIKQSEKKIHRPGHGSPQHDRPPLGGGRQ